MIISKCGTLSGPGESHPKFRLYPWPIGSLIILSFVTIQPIAIYAAETGVSCGSNGRRVLWVEAEGATKPYISRHNFTLIKELIEKWRVTDVYAQVYRGGRSWFPSVRADDSPFHESIKAGINPLSELTKFAHSRGVRVHAWLNVFSLAGNDDAPVLQIIGDDGVLRDEFGVSVLAYDSDGRAPRVQEDRLDTPAVWIDPASIAYRLYFAELVRELASYHPELDGIHLDMIRYPYLMARPDMSGRRAQLGFSQESMRRFFGRNRRGDECVASAAGSSAILSWEVLARGLPTGSAWDQWRRDQVTDLVRHVREELKTRPMELSAAVLAPYERAYVYAHQPWKDWLEDGLIDFAVPMAYQRGVERYREVVADSLRDTDGRRVILGVGAWLSLDQPNVLADQMRIACQGASGGVSLFSFSHLASDRGKRAWQAISRSKDELLF